MKLSQFALPVTESSTHIESAELMQELKGYQEELQELFLKLDEHGQFGQKVARLEGIDTSYFYDIKTAAEQLMEHVNDLYTDLEKHGTGDGEVEEENEEEVEGETSSEEPQTEEE